MTRNNSPTLGGMPIKLRGQFPLIGTVAPFFTLVNKDLQNISLETFKGKRKILNIVPSLDTQTCKASARRFNKEASELDNTVVINISADLPFAMARFCSSEGLENVINLSTMRGRNFMSDYGVEITDSPLEGLAARAVIILDESNIIRYTELVSAIENEPNYEAALRILKVK
jgi:thiol peroxidase